MKNDSINDTITKNIQTQLVNLLPEEDIRAKVDFEIERFFKNEKTSYGQISPSPFAKLVNEAIQEKVKRFVVELFNSPEWKVTVDEQLQVTIGSALETVLRIHPDVLKNTVAESIAKSNAIALMNLLRNQLSNVDYNLGNAVGNAINNYE